MMKSLGLRFLSILFVTGLLAAGAQAASFQAIDSNKDGKIDLSEVKPVAARRFDQLDRKRTGTLTRAQLGRLRVSRAEFAAADPDNDGTLTKDEYLALVEKRFHAADTDHAGALTLQQFNARAALPLRRLL
jgi:Ca2+-binding EF-hand superfamily protein